MATRPAPEETRVERDTRDEKVARDFVYRDDMGLKEVAQYLGNDRDFDRAYDWVKEKLEKADEDDE